MAMESPLVSLIVPVYNVETYLRPCLESIRAQRWPALEVLLVNDGSTDASLSICQEYAALDPRFKVIDQPNAGVSAARNRAISVAQGKYLQFADGDDKLPPNATEILASAAERTGADLVTAHFYRVIGDKIAQRGHIKRECCLTRADYAEEMVKAPANYYYGVLWNKLYRRSIVERHQMHCDEQVAWCEDFLFNLEYLRYCRLIAAVPAPVYYYYKRKGSLVTSRISLRKTIQMKKTTFATYKQLYQSLDLYEEQRLAIYRYLVSAATDGTAFTLPKPEEE